MARCLAAVCALVLVVLSSACRDSDTCSSPDMSTGSHHQGLQPPESQMLQREIDLADLLDLKEPSTSEGMAPPRLRPSFRPRSFLPALSYEVRFPLGRPTSDNIQAICLHGDHRVRYPRSYFPSSGFSKQKRMAAAVNNGEFWFSVCCKQNQTRGTDQTLCCATQAWELSVKLFCEEDSSVKDRQDECCRQMGSNRLSCFAEAAPNPSYEPMEPLPVESLPSSETFHFLPNTCPRNLMTPHRPRGTRRRPETNQPASQKINISFPPGRPTAENIQSLCDNRKLRPLYTTKCLPRSGYRLLARQVKTVNRLEKAFKRCCKKKKDVLNCAELKWREELDRFCTARSDPQESAQCCSDENEHDRYSCFQLSSPEPHYNPPSPDQPPLSKLCDTHRVVDKRFAVGFPLSPIVKQCCTLQEENKTNCLAQKIEEKSQTLCSSNKTTTPAISDCCAMAPSEKILQCFVKTVTTAIAKVKFNTSKVRQKICPIS